MASDHDQTAPEDAPDVSAPDVASVETGMQAGRWGFVVAVAAAVVGLVLAGLWLSRERIADNVIAAQLTRMGLPATYRIERIGGAHQVLGDIRVGNPRRPDLTIERAEVDILYSFGWPRIGTVRLVRPRLYGHYRNGRLSFGALDKVLFPQPPSAEPFRLPDFALELVDARARLLTDHGPIGFRAEGAGPLRDGFSGQIAALAPHLSWGSCQIAGTSLYGKVRVDAEKPRFSGPLRMAVARCSDGATALDDAVAALDLTGAARFDAVSVAVKLRSKRLQTGSLSAQTSALDGTISWRDGTFHGRVTGDVGGVATPAATVALLGVEGRVRARDRFGKWEVQGSLDGRGVAPGSGLDQSLASTEQASAGTLLAPMAGQIRRALQQERPGSRLTAEVTARNTGQGVSLVVPTAQLRGGSGAVLLSLSRFQFVGGSAGAQPRISGNFATSGPGLPQIVGRMEQGERALPSLRLSMEPFRAGGGELVIPGLSVMQAANGALTFTGEVRMSGALPGGSARNLALPFDGGVSPDGALALFRNCITPRFDSLALANLVIERQAISLCPSPGRAIVTSGPQGLRVAAGLTNLNLAGNLGLTPIRIKSGPIGFAWPGTVTARMLDVELGPVDTATRFRLSNLSARLGGTVTGSFAGAEAQLFSVPLDISNASGNWNYAQGRLTIADGRFDLTDRADPDRFHLLKAEGAGLSLFASRIDAQAALREPATGREVVRATIRHDLESGNGHADMRVDRLTFDKALQPDKITPLALGVVANVSGDVRGRGTIDWDARGVRSKGAFSTDDLSFAAAFGPVNGLSGTVRFSDLLGLVTEPDQRLRIASINPGIAVPDGEVSFALLPGSLLRVNGATWPFLGGRLTLKPVDLNIGRAETRRYVLVIDGLDAGQFVQHMDLENISATGTFDGELPLVFDSFGGRVEQGLLTSRQPGGNVSYVGALSYKDLSAMANFAFDALKSLDYRHMTIAMDGALEGEIVTRVRFDGVKQGATARRNFVTRAIGNLPIQFNINVRAPFYRLISSIKAMYDPAFIEDPRVLGLVDSAGRPVRGKTTDKGNAAKAGPEQPAIQSSESGKMR